MERHSIEGYDEIELVGLELSERDDKEPGVKWEWRLELETEEIELVEVDDDSLLTAVGWTGCWRSAGRLATVSGPPNRWPRPYHSLTMVDAREKCP